MKVLICENYYIFSLYLSIEYQKSDYVLSKYSHPKLEFMVIDEQIIIIQNVNTEHVVCLFSLAKMQQESKYILGIRVNNVLFAYLFF